MPITQGITGSGQTPEASEALAFSARQHGKMISTIIVQNASSATGNASVRVPELHGSTGFATIRPGQSHPFRVKDGEIEDVYISGENAIVDWFGVAKTKFH